MKVKNAMSKSPIKSIGRANSRGIGGKMGGGRGGALVATPIKDTLATRKMR